MDEEMDPDVISLGNLYPRWATIFIAICAICFCIVGVAGNLATIIALLRSTKLRGHATTTFVVSLAVSDLLFCTTNLPLMTSRYIKNAWVHGEAVCVMFAYTGFANISSSMMGMAAITLNRYVLICHRVWYDRLYTRTHIALMLCFVWGFGAALMTLPLFGVWGRLGQDMDLVECTMLEDKHGRSPKLAVLLIGFLIPCLAIVASYCRIYLVVRSTRLQLQKNDVVAIAGGSRDDLAEGRITQPHRQDELRLTRMICLISGLFILCFLPSALVKAMKPDTMGKRLAHLLAYIPVWFSSVVNPFVYAVSNRNYREAYADLIRSLCCCTQFVHRVTERLRPLQSINTSSSYSPKLSQDCKPSQDSNI